MANTSGTIRKNLPIQEARHAMVSYEGQKTITTPQHNKAHNLAMRRLNEGYALAWVVVELRKAYAAIATKVA